MESPRDYCHGGLEAQALHRGKVAGPEFVFAKHERDGLYALRELFHGDGRVGGGDAHLDFASFFAVARCTGRILARCVGFAGAAEKVEDFGLLRGDENSRTIGNVGL